MNINFNLPNLNIFNQHLPTIGDVGIQFYIFFIQLLKSLLYIQCQILSLIIQIFGYPLHETADGLYNIFYYLITLFCLTIKSLFNIQIYVPFNTYIYFPILKILKRLGRVYTVFFYLFCKGLAILGQGQVALQYQMIHHQIVQGQPTLFQDNPVVPSAYGFWGIPYINFLMILCICHTVFFCLISAQIYFRIDRFSMLYFEKQKISTRLSTYADFFCFQTVFQFLINYGLYKFNIHYPFIGFILYIILGHIMLSYFIIQLQGIYGFLGIYVEPEENLSKRALKKLKEEEQIFDSEFIERNNGEQMFQQFILFFCFQVIGTLFIFLQQYIEMILPKVTVIQSAKVQNFRIPHEKQVKYGYGMCTDSQTILQNGRQLVQVMDAKQHHSIVVSEFLATCAIIPYCLLVMTEVYKNNYEDDEEDEDDEEEKQQKAMEMEWERRRNKSRDRRGRRRYNRQV